MRLHSCPTCLTCILPDKWHVWPWLWVLRSLPLWPFWSCMACLGLCPMSKEVRLQGPQHSRHIALRAAPLCSGSYGCRD